MDELRQAKHPVTSLAGWYGHPLHPALVSIPIGAWVTSVVFDVASRVTDDPTFLVRGATWLLLIGVAGALAAGLIGFLDLVVIPTGTRAFRTVLLHVTLTLLATAVFAVDALIRRNADTDTATAVGPLALSIGGLVILLAGGFLGGALVFRYGVRVAEERHQIDGYAAPTRHGSGPTGPGVMPTPPSHRRRDR